MQVEHHWAAMGSVDPDEINRDMQWMTYAESDIKTIIRKVFTRSEIAFPPLGYVLSFGLEPLDNELTDISFFAKHGYDEKIPISVETSPFIQYTRTILQIIEPKNKFNVILKKTTRIEKEIQERKQAEGAQ